MSNDTQKGVNNNNRRKSEESSAIKIPKWLEDLSDVKRKHSGSTKLSHGSSPDTDSSKSQSFSPPAIDLSSPLPSLEILDISKDDEVFLPQRENSARFGRRANSAVISRSAGNSPTKTSQTEVLEDPFSSFNPEIRRASAGRRADHLGETDLSLEESWNSLSFFEKKHKGRLRKESDGEKNLSTSSEQRNGNVPHNNVQDQNNKDAVDNNSDADFIIPELPHGKELVINILSTWGDRHYLGLNGIEIYSRTGEPVPISKIWADPSDINVLPEYSKDPRVVTNLLDGVNRTHDDLHLWLAPFTPGSDHLIHIVFQQPVSVAMIRIWNYNKSRIHSFRGVKDVEITLDNVTVFRGEIARACGGILGGTEAFGDTILFTTDETILELISQYDSSFSSPLNEGKKDGNGQEDERPVTAYGGADERPYTCPGNSHSEPPSNGSFLLYGGQKLEIILLSNWGHSTMIGLTGFEVLGECGNPLPIEPQYLQCSALSPDIYRLIDGVNVTTDENHMWSTPYVSGHVVVLTISFPLVVYISALRIWNYNNSSDLSYCGVKTLTIHLDGRLVSLGSDGVMIARRAPGNCHFNFAQDLDLVQQQPENSSSPVIEKQLSGESYPHHHHSIMDFVDEEEYEPPNMPQGFVFQLTIFSTWGDPYYVGLNGLELYDDDGDRIKLSENHISAFPDSVNVLEGIDNDVRTPEKLVDGINDTFDGRHMWLAPILPNQLNRVYIVFDYPVTVSMIKLWNYSKSPSRGVKEFGILVDDLLVYNGILDKVSKTTGSTESSNEEPHVPYRTVLFTNDKRLLIQEHETHIRNSSYGHNVSLLNDHHRVTSGGSHLSADQSQRPFTSLVPPTRSKSTHNM